MLICNVICDVFFKIVRCDDVENYVPYRIMNDACGWIVIWRSSQELYVFTYSLQVARLNNPDAIQHNGMTNSETEMCS